MTDEQIKEFSEHIEKARFDDQGYEIDYYTNEDDNYFCGDGEESHEYRITDKLKEMNLSDKVYYNYR